MINNYHFVHIAPCFVDLTQETGGVANVVRQLCLLSRQHGHQITLICSNTELGRVVAEPAFYVSQDGVAVHVIAQNTNPLIGPPRNVLKALDLIFQSAGQERLIGHVHTCFSCLTETAMNFFSKRSVPFVFSPHGKLSPNMFQRHYFAKLLWWWGIARSKVVQARFIGVLAEKESVLLPKLGLQIPRRVIPNGYHPLPFEDLVVSNLPECYILYLGYIDPRKQPDFLVKAYSKAKASKTHKLIFVGPDSYGFWNKVAELAVNCGVISSVIFWGAAYGNIKWHLLRQASCLCLPSLAEGHPIVLCEALGAGLPSVYSVECNFPEIAERGAGIQLHNFNEVSWADAIDEVVLNKSTNTSMRKSAAFMAEEYTWESAVGKWEALYSECLR